MDKDLKSREAKERLERLAAALDSLEVEGPLQAQVIQELLAGSRTIGEVTQALYGVGRGEQGFPSTYMRVRRAIKRLESKGYVSAPLLGRDKPYRLTRLGSQAIAGVLSERPLIERGTFRGFILGTTLMIGLATMLPQVFPASARAQLSALFFVLLGMSIMVSISWASEVW